MIPERQRKQITLNGVKYRLVVPRREWVGEAGEARGEGPLYERVPMDPQFQFEPDLAYLVVASDAKRPKPSFMHPIQR